VAFFTIIYPLGGTLTQETDANAFDTLVRVGSAVYIVVISLYQRMSSRTKPAEAGT
jgi:hypothetical protein